MHALLCKKWCKFYELEIESVPEPDLRPKGVRIAVHSAGVSFAASLWVQGKYQRKPQLPFTPGTEISGTVLECASGVTRCKPGDRVVAALDWGGMAEQVVASDVSVFPVPKNVDLAAAPNLPVSYNTAYSALIWRTGLKAGETLLVFGAAGAVGLAAVQIAKAIGAVVIACASSGQKLEALKKHGADLTINYKTEDIRTKTLEFTDEKGAQVVFDPVGGDTFKAGLRSVGQEGRILIIGFAGGNIQQIPANILLVKNVTILGFNFGEYVGWGLKDERELYAELVQSWYSNISGLCMQGKLKPTLYKALPLTEFTTAMDLILSRKVIGKVVLQPGSKER